MVVGVENRIALLLPPEPVLHDRVQRNMLGAVAVRNIQKLLCGDIPVLRLKESIRTSRQKRSVSRQVSILMDDLVHLRAKDQVVVNVAAGVGCEAELQREAIVGV